MAIRGEIGETAGEVWRLLSSAGPQTLGQIKKKVGSKGELLSYALGWLAREDKIEFVPEKKTLRLQAKE